MIAALPPELLSMLEGMGIEQHEAAVKANAHLKEIRTAMQLAHQFCMVHLERCHDLGVPSWMALIAMYELMRLQINANIERGALGREQLKFMRVGADLVRNPDGHTVPLEFDEAGNRKRS